MRNEYAINEVRKVMRKTAQIYLKTLMKRLKYYKISDDEVIKAVNHLVDDGEINLIETYNCLGKKVLQVVII